MKQIEELKRLNLPRDKFSIFGSGPLAIRGLRESNDVDLIVKFDLFEKLERKYQSKKIINNGREIELIKIGYIEIYKDWSPRFDNIEKLIDDSEIIEGFPFVRLKYVLEWKIKYGRKKDKKILF